jgi:MFS family permease
VIGTLVLFMLDLLTMAVFADHQTVVIVGIVASGAFIGNNNTLITEAVMGVAPVERPVASAAYSFVRFCGGAIGPYVALKLFGLPPDIHVHAPFVFGAVMVAIGIVIIASGAGVLTRALEGNHEARSAGHEAEAMLVGDLD